MNSQDLLNSGINLSFDKFKLKGVHDIQNEDIPEGCVLISVKNSCIEVYSGKLVKPSSKDRLRHFMTFFINHAKGLDLDCKFVVNMLDENVDCSFSIFQFYKHLDSHNLVFPDLHYMAFFLNYKPFDSIEFAKKREGFVFRGSDTGSKTVLKNERITLANIFSKRYDIGISQFVRHEEDEIQKNGIDTSRIKKGFLSKLDQSRYKYIADIVGNTVSWDRNIWAMGLNCVLFKLYHFDTHDIHLWYSKYMDEQKVVPTVSSNDLDLFLESDNTEYLNRQKEFSKLLNEKNNHISFFRKSLEIYNHEYNK